MSMIDDDQLEGDVPEQAVRGLNQASQRARDAGRSVVVVRDRQLILLDTDGFKVLKQLPARQKVTPRRKVVEP